MPASFVFVFFFGLGGSSILSSSAELKVPPGTVTVLDVSVPAGSGVGFLGGSSSSLRKQLRMDQKQAGEYVKTKLDVEKATDELTS